MRRDLRISIGQHSDQGRKDSNQDFYGALIPGQPALALKGIAIGLADGISSSSVSRVAAETAIKSFFTDYYCTSEAWSVKTSAQRVIAATNAWLHTRSRESQYAHDRDKGYVCTLSLMVLKSATAHIFHIGDCRIYRLAGTALEQLTEDHRITLPGEGTYLGRAMGAAAEVEIDYRQVPVVPGDVFVLATDGVYDFVPARVVTKAIAEQVTDLDAAARAIVNEAHDRGSDDNLTVQIVRIEEVADADATEAAGHAAELPPAPLLEPRMMIDGYRIDRRIHGSSRSHIYLATDTANGQCVAIKIPSVDLRDDPAYLKRFMMEEWIARRIDNAHVLKPHPPSRPRTCLYVANEFIEGQTLRQWIIDHPRPQVEQVRGIVEQIAKGLRAFHRKEMLHQDLRPENIMIDIAGTAKIIDFGSTRVAGVMETMPPIEGDDILGTFQYTAPEYFLGEAGSNRSDLFSLGVIAYEMLTGSLPYGAAVSRLRSHSQMARLRYIPARSLNPAVPGWMDGALRKAVQPDPDRRYEALSEFLHDLREPNGAFLKEDPAPLIERNPMVFWQALSFLLLCGNVVLLYFLRR